ncbi:response regulator [Paenibacillus solisilvae]|uniref:Response regulator n=1 Tax=Paenibacillus solisilvae TaxID=2486751 RepID=A0ABW0W473_9BACL
MRILIVDDEALIRDHLGGLLEWEAVHCTVVGKASNGLEALEMIQKTGPTLVITDIRMPAMNGLELAEHLRADHPHIHVMFISAYHDFEYAKQAMKLGVCDFITKPIRIPELLESVELLQQGVLRMNEDDRLEQEKLMALLLACEGEPDEAAVLIRRRQVEDRQIQVALVEIDNAELLYLSDRPLSLMVLREIVDHRLKDQPRLYWTYLDRNGIIAVFFEPDGSEFGTGSEPLAIAGGLVTDVKEITGHSVSVGISRRLPSVLAIREGLWQSRQCLEYRMLLGKGSIISFDALAQLEQGRVSREEKAIVELIGHVRLADQAQIAASLRGIYREMLASGMNKNVIQQYAAEILSRTDALFEELHFPVDQERRIQAQKSLFGYSILADLLQFLSDYLGKAAESIAARSHPEQPTVVKRVFDYLDKHCTEEISLLSLSRHLHINHSYLSRLIKKETGVNFRDLLWKYRIDKAKELMRRGEGKTFEIAYEVGFKDPSHFSQVFKRTVGVSPSGYRDSLTPEQQQVNSSTDR